MLSITETFRSPAESFLMGCIELRKGSLTGGGIKGHAASLACADTGVSDEATIPLELA